METERQPAPTKNGASYSLRDQILTKVMAPIAMPLVFGLTEVVVLTGCGTKGKLQTLEATMKNQEGLNKTQTDEIVGIKNKLLTLETDVPTAFDKQRATNQEQNEKINNLTRADEEQTQAIEQLQTAVSFLQSLQQSADSPSVSTPEETPTSGDTIPQPTHQSIDLEWDKVILSYLVEYRRSLPLLSNLQTAIGVADEAAAKRRNIIKKVLTTGEAWTHSHVTGKTTKVTIPKEKTFDFKEVLETIDNLSPTEKIIAIDEVINKLNEKITLMEEAQTERTIPLPPSDLGLSREADLGTPNGGQLTATDQTAKPQVPATQSKPRPQPAVTSILSTSPTTSLQESAYTPLEDLPSNLPAELIPLEMIQTGQGKYRIYELDLNQLPFDDGRYVYIIYGVRGIIVPPQGKSIQFKDDLIVIKPETRHGTCQIRLSDGMIFLFDTSNDAGGEQLKSFIQSTLNEHTDFYHWPRRRSDKVKTITLQ